MSPRQLQLSVGLLFFLAWEMAPRLGLVPPIILASLSETLAVPFTQFSTFGPALVVTLSEIVGALAIAYVGGGVIGIIVGSSRVLRVTALPLISSVYAIPFVVIYPILTAWLGIGTASKVWFGGIYGFFPMALASAAGVQTVDSRYVMAARAMGASRFQLLTQIYVPAALPSIVSGLRLGGALVTIGVVQFACCDEAPANVAAASRLVREAAARGAGWCCSPRMARLPCGTSPSAATRTPWRIPRVTRCRPWSAALPSTGRASHGVTSRTTSGSAPP